MSPATACPPATSAAAASSTPRPAWLPTLAEATTLSSLRSDVISWRPHAPGWRLLAGKPAVVFFGNNAAGRSALTGRVPGEGRPLDRTRTAHLQRLALALAA